MKRVYRPDEVALAMRHVPDCGCEIETTVMDLRCVESYTVPVAVGLMKPCPCATREDHDGERITTHCAGHCPRVAAGDWSECRGC